MSSIHYKGNKRYGHYTNERIINGICYSINDNIVTLIENRREDTKNQTEDT